MQTAKSRGIIRHIMVLSLLTFLALAAPHYWQRTKAESAATTAGLPALRGEAALTHLKERGLYSSLGEAVNAARHSAQPLPQAIAPLLAQSAQLTAGDGAAEDYFAAAVAISGDTAIVGAPRNDINADADRGAAYVFVRSGGMWTQQEKLKAPTGTAGDFFGASVGISGDTAIVGAYLNDVGGNAIKARSISSRGRRASGRCNRKSLPATAWRTICSASPSPLTATPRLWARTRIKARSMSSRAAAGAGLSCRSSPPLTPRQAISSV
jgi:hypothetical protein